MHFFSSLLPLALSASLALAAPIEDGMQFEKRAASFGTYGDWTGSVSSFADGSGSYVNSADDHRYASGVHCWTDLFYVGHKYEAQNWVRDDTSIDCGTTQNCASGKVDSKERCVSWTLGASVDIGAINTLASLVGITGNIGFSGEGGQEHCTAAQSTNVCTWDDKGCHSVWTSDVVLVTSGYVRRRCDSKDGDYTAWSHDYSVSLPQPVTRIGCAAGCADTTYPGPLPLPPNA